jgi:hypothetical protein
MLKSYWYRAKKIKAQFVTINPSSENTLLNVQKCMQSIAQSVKNLDWVHEFRYTYEQRGKTTTDIGKGIHVHCLILIDNSKNPSDINKHLKRIILKHRLISKDNITNPCIYNMVKLSKIDDYNDRISYMEGVKQDKKLLTVSFDKLFREQNNLLPMYRVK